MNSTAAMHRIGEFLKKSESKMAKQKDRKKLRATSPTMIVPR
jgi:hypothetical protein